MSFCLISLTTKRINDIYLVHHGINISCINRLYFLFFLQDHDLNSAVIDTPFSVSMISIYRENMSTIYRYIDISMKNSFQLSFSFKTAYTTHSMYIYPHVSFKRSNYNSFPLLTFLWLKTVIFMKTTTWLFLRNFHADISIFENVYRYTCIDNLKCISVYQYRSNQWQP